MRRWSSGVGLVTVTALNKKEGFSYYTLKC